jgi:hypothetical protein
MGDINRQRLPRHFTESVLARDQKFRCWQNDNRKQPGCATRVSTFTGINRSLFRRTSWVTVNVTWQQMLESVHITNLHTVSWTSPLRDFTILRRPEQVCAVPCNITYSAQCTTQTHTHTNKDWINVQPLHQIDSVNDVF